MENVLAISSCGALDQWDCASGSLRHSKAALSGQGRAGCTTSIVCAFIANSLEPCIVFCPNERRSVIVLELSSMKQLLYCSLPEIPTTLNVSPDGFCLAVGSQNGFVHIWSLQSGVMLTSFQPHLKDVRSLAFSADGTWLITSSADSSIFVYDLGGLVSCSFGSIPNPLMRCTDHHLPVNTIATFPISNRFLSGSLDRTCRLWTIGKQEPDFVFEYDSGVTSIAIDPAEAFFCVGAINGRIYRSRLLHSATTICESSQISSSLDVSGSSCSKITSLALNYDASLLVSADESQVVKIWDLLSCQCVHTLRNASSPRSQYRLVMCQLPKESFINRNIINGFSCASEIQPLQKLLERPEARRSVITLHGALPSNSRHVHCLERLEMNCFLNQDRKLQAQVLTQKAKIAQIGEERDRWAQVASRLYDICSNQILS